MSLTKKALIFLTASLAFGAPVSFAQAKPSAVRMSPVDPSGFSAFLQLIKERAVAEGVRPEVASEVIRATRFQPKAIKLDRKQSEFTITFDKYLQNQAPASRVKKAAAHYRQNKAKFDAIERRFGVEPQFILALWGIETNFGRNTGGFHVPSVLATLAYEGRRGEFFTKEYINAMKIIQEGNISARSMSGSWAGAMGQSQFMPSSFLKYAVDITGDGTRDIWRAKSDVWGSIANYLRTEGWQKGARWSVPARFPSDMNALNLSETETDAKPLSYWASKGISPKLPVSGSPDTVKARFVVPKRSTGVAYLTFENFDTIMHWNKSHFFAVSVGTLADKIARAIGK